MTKEELAGLVAQGWCTDENKNKEMDTDLAMAITQILWDKVFTNGGS